MRNLLLVLLIAGCKAEPNSGPMGARGPDGATGPAGEVGTAGVPGEQGPAGPAGLPSSKVDLYTVSGDVDVFPGTFAEATAECEGNGDILLTGNCTASRLEFLTLESFGAGAVQNVSDTSRAIWTCQYRSEAAGTEQIHALALCIDMSGP